MTDTEPIEVGMSHETYRRVIELAHAEERARIVAWLRKRAEAPALHLDVPYEIFPDWATIAWCADAIEKDEHRA